MPRCHAAIRNETDLVELVGDPRERDGGIEHGDADHHINSGRCLMSVSAGGASGVSSDSAAADLAAVMNGGQVFADRLAQIDDARGDAAGSARQPDGITGRGLPDWPASISQKCSRARSLAFSQMTLSCLPQRWVVGQFDVAGLFTGKRTVRSAYSWNA